MTPLPQSASQKWHFGPFTLLSVSELPYTYSRCFKIVRLLNGLKPLTLHSGAVLFGMRYFFLFFSHRGRPEIWGGRTAIHWRRLGLDGTRLMVNRRRLAGIRQQLLTTGELPSNLR